MATVKGRLGWRHPRPNDYQGPDQRPLRDTFSDLQHFMTWPHFGVTIDSSQAVGASLVKRTIAPAEDPYMLVRGASDEIQVPKDFDRWLFVGNASAILDVNGPVRAVLGWFLNGANAFPDADDETQTAAGWTNVRVASTLIHPVSKNDVLSIAIYTSAASTVDEGQGWGYFLPLV